MYPKKVRIVVDSSYLLPSLGISVANIEPDDFELISQLREHFDYTYPAPLLAELVAKATREASRRGLKRLPQEAVEGFKAILAGVAVTVALPDSSELALASELWIRGHKDIMDDIAYAQAVKSGGYFMTLDEGFRQFLSENDYSDKVITHRNLKSLVSGGSR